MIFKCKQFDVLQSDEVFKITTDATLLGALAWNDIKDFDRRVKVLEVGSGTGIVSLMLAQRFGNIQIDAIDINKSACQLSTINFQNSTYKNRLHASLQDILYYKSNVDHIIINPPYFQSDTQSSDPALKQARHLENMNYQKLITVMLSTLNKDGSIEMIHPFRYLSEIKKHVKSSGASLSRLIKIRHNVNSPVRNCISRIELKKLDTKSIFFNIKGGNNDFSYEYVQLLRPFINV